MADMEKPPPYSASQTNPLNMGPATLPPGYHSVPTSGLPNYGSTVYVQQPPVPQPQILIVGGCPACRVGVLEDDFTCLGVCLAVLFFPLGILCCLALRERRCPNCGAIFG